METVCSVRKVMGDIGILNDTDKDEVSTFSNKITALCDNVTQTKHAGFEELYKSIYIAREQQWIGACHNKFDGLGAVGSY